MHTCGLMSAGVVIREPIRFIISIPPIKWLRVALSLSRAVSSVTDRWTGAAVAMEMIRRPDMTNRMEEGEVLKCKLLWIDVGAIFLDMKRSSTLAAVQGLVLLNRCQSCAFISIMLQKPPKWEHWLQYIYSLVTKGNHHGRAQYSFGTKTRYLI